MEMKETLSFFTRKQSCCGLIPPANKVNWYILFSFKILQFNSPSETHFLFYIKLCNIMKIPFLFYVSYLQQYYLIIFISLSYSLFWYFFTDLYTKLKNDYDLQDVSLMHQVVKCYLKKDSIFIQVTEGKFISVYNKYKCFECEYVTISKTTTQIVKHYLKIHNRVISVKSFTIDVYSNLIRRSIVGSHVCQACYKIISITNTQSPHDQDTCTKNRKQLSKMIVLTWKLKLIKELKEALWDFFIITDQAVDSFTNCLRS